MRSVEVVGRLEAELGKPVICSNQAMLFTVLKALSINLSSIACGRLFKQEIAA